jgi:hypothetical protein
VIRGSYPPIGHDGDTDTRQAVSGWRQGFVSNITNPKVAVFYLAVLPQFLGAHAGIGADSTPRPARRCWGSARSWHPSTGSWRQSVSA